MSNNDRRGFLAASAGLGAVAIAPGVHLISVSHARPAGEPASSLQRWGMLVDTTKCASGCDACVSACATENGINETVADPRQAAQWIRKIDIKDPKSGYQHSLPMMCQHCAEPPCVDVCPTGASMKRADGIVLVDRHICIGCRYCMMACPYKARSFVHEALSDQSINAPRGKGCVESCTLCVHRIDEGVLRTACQEACEKEGHAAILFGDLKDPDSEISQVLKSRNSVQIRADLELNTGVRYLNL